MGLARVPFSFYICTVINKQIVMLKTYNELSDDLKSIARELHPNDYNKWSYKTQGVEIAFSCK